MGNSLFSQLLKRRKSPTFANAYTPPFFERKLKFQSVTTAALFQAGLLSVAEDLGKGGLYQDFTNRILGKGDTRFPDDSVGSR